MVTQAPRRSAVIAALAFTLSCIGLIIFVWTQFGGSVEFAPAGYRVSALFKETGLLVPGADVRISGVDVGKVSAVRARGVDSFVTMDIATQYAPIPSDTRAILRQKTLLGEAYIELSAGNGAGSKLHDGGVLPSSQVERTQSLDQVLASFDKPAQRDLQGLLNGSYAALSGRGQDLNDAIGNLDPTVTELSAIVGALNDQQGDVRALVRDGGTVLSALASRSGDLQSLIGAGDQVLSATAARDRQLGGTVDALPPFLTELRSTLSTLDTTLGLARPSLRELRPVAPLVPGTLANLIRLSGPAVHLLREAPPVLDAAIAALPSVTRFTSAFEPSLEAILPAAQQVAPVIGFTGLYGEELTTAMANLAADLEATAPAATTSGSASYLRAVIGVNDETPFGQSVRSPNNRSNAYFAPGELANVARGGLESASCANTRNTAQFPIPSDNVPCRVQPPFAWGSGIASAYFPRLRAAPH